MNSTNDSSGGDGERIKFETFQEIKNILQEADKGALLNVLNDCWQTNHADVQDMISTAATKKQKEDQEIQKMKNQDRKDIFETSWVFSDPYTDCQQKLDIKNNTIRLGLYHEHKRDLSHSEIKWDDTNSVLVARIEDNGCLGCSVTDEVLTVSVERNKLKTKKRVKVTSYAECCCTYDHGNWLLRQLHAEQDDYGYPEGAE